MVDNKVQNPLIQSIELRLIDFEFNIPVWGITVFTVDGYVLAHRLFHSGMPDQIENTISVMSASLISIAEDFTRFASPESAFRQIIIDADEPTTHSKFSILLRQIADNVQLTCIFPESTQLGLLLYEIDHLSDQLREDLNNWKGLIHEETVT